MEICAGNLGSLVNSGSITLAADTNEPTGFVNRTDSIVSFDPLTRTLTIAPVADSFSVYVVGTKLTFYSPLSVSFPDLPGTYYFYIDGGGVLHQSSVFSLDYILTVAIAAMIYWNSTTSSYVIFGDERHGIVMDGATHQYLHTTIGAQYVSGFGITYTLGNGNLNSDAQISLAGGMVADEDIRVTVVDDSTPTEQFQQILSPIAKIPILYRANSHWFKTTATNYPLVFGTARAQYNYFNGTTWMLQDAPSNNKVCVTYIFGLTSFTEPVVGILGQAQYQNLAEAQKLAKWQNIDFGAMPAPEMVLLYTIYYETSTTYNNAVKSRIIDVLDNRYDN